VKWEKETAVLGRREGLFLDNCIQEKKNKFN
jgi:hypothetical protein